MNDLSNAERETHLNMTADERGQWVAFSDDPVMCARLDKIAQGTPYGSGMLYTLDKAQVSLRKKPKPLTEAQRAKLAKRLQKARTVQAAE